MGKYVGPRVLEGAIVGTRDGGNVGDMVGITVGGIVGGKEGDRVGPLDGTDVTTNDVGLEDGCG